MTSTVQLLLIFAIGINGTRIKLWIYKQLFEGIVVISEKKHFKLQVELKNVGML